MTVGRTTQEAVEVLSIGDPAARVSQSAVEALSRSDPAGRVSQVAVEVLSLSSGVASTTVAIGFIGG